MLLRHKRRDEHVTEEHSNIVREIEHRGTLNCPLNHRFSLVLIEYRHHVSALSNTRHLRLVALEVLACQEQTNDGHPHRAHDQWHAEGQVQQTYKSSQRQGLVKVVHVPNKMLRMSPTNQFEV